MYCKINDENNYLMLSSIQTDETWLIEDDYIKNGKGDLYTYYIDPQTPDMVKENALDSELSYKELQEQLKSLTIEFMNHTFSGSQEQQNFVNTMLTKIEGENPNSTRNIYAIDGRTRVPMSKSDMLDFMTEVDIAQEAITNA